MRHDHAESPELKLARKPREIPNLVELCHNNVAEIRQLLSELESRLEPVTAEGPYPESAIAPERSTEVGRSLQTLSDDQNNVIYRLQRLLSNLEI